MKKLFALIFCCFITSILFAQTSKQIEADLLKSFKKIARLMPRGLFESDTTRGYSDSLVAANDSFSNKLKDYTTRFPFTISQSFQSLRDSVEETGLCWTDSPDGKLRFYAWDTGMGGTQPDIASVIQYKTGTKTKSVVVDEDIKIPFYDTIYILKRNNKTYYLAIYDAKMGFHEFIAGVRVFSIENETLNHNVLLIKTKTGLHNRIEYSYTRSYTDEVEDDIPAIHYNEKSAIFKIPVVLENGNWTGNYITYKFTGQYFEQVKN